MEGGRRLIRLSLDASRLCDPTTREAMMTTGKKDASKASKLLKSSTSTADEKSVAGSDLAQAKKKSKPKKKK